MHGLSSADWWKGKTGEKRGWRRCCFLAYGYYPAPNLRASSTGCKNISWWHIHVFFFEDHQWKTWWVILLLISCRHWLFRKIGILNHWLLTVMQAWHGPKTALKTALIYQQKTLTAISWWMDFTGLTMSKCVNATFSTRHLGWKIRLVEKWVTGRRGIGVSELTCHSGSPRQPVTRHQPPWFLSRIG